MRTLLEIAEQVRSGIGVRSATGWPPGVAGKVRLRIPDSGAVLLPKQPEALGAWMDAGDDGPFPGDPGAAARAALLTEPSFLAALPSASTLTELDIDTSGWGNRENPLPFLAAVGYKHDGVTRYGIARTLVVENLLGFGASKIVAHDEVWYGDLEEFSDQLALAVLASENLRPAPEGDSKPWKTVMLLLNDEALELDLPEGWQRSLKLVAGLYGVSLDVHANAWSAQKEVVRQLKQRPPHALLVADRSIRVPDTFLGPYRRARPDGYGEVLGTQLAKDFSEHILELGLHLRSLADLQAATVRANGVQAPTDWSVAARLIRKLEGDHFRLTERARTMLPGNPYADVVRMYEHVHALAELALKYHQNNGQLGRRLEDVAIDEHAIEIALFDSSLKANVVESHGHLYEAVVHVKVDDAKSPDKVGRIYFALDNRRFVFVVDHIGLHDYP